MSEIIPIVLLAINLFIVWKVCERQPINIHVYIASDGGVDRFEGDEWKDGPIEGTE